MNVNQKLIGNSCWNLIFTENKWNVHNSRYFRNWKLKSRLLRALRCLDWLMPLHSLPTKTIDNTFRRHEKCNLININIDEIPIDFKFMAQVNDGNSIPSIQQLSCRSVPSILWCLINLLKMIKSNRYSDSIEHCLLQAQFVDMNFDPNKLNLSKPNENQKKFRFKNSKKTPKVQIVVRIIENSC